MTKRGEGRSERSLYFIPKEITTSEFVSLKNPFFFYHTEKPSVCFCINLFFYLSSGMLKYANFNFGFGQKQSYTEKFQIYVLTHKLKNTMPKKIPVFFFVFFLYNPKNPGDLHIRPKFLYSQKII